MEILKIHGNQKLTNGGGRLFLFTLLMMAFVAACKKDDNNTSSNSNSNTTTPTTTATVKKYLTSIQTNGYEGNSTSTVSSSGTLNFTYNSNQLITEFSNVYKFVYDNKNRLSTIFRNDGQTQTLNYDSEGKFISAIWGSGGNEDLEVLEWNNNQLPSKWLIKKTGGNTTYTLNYYTDGSLKNVVKGNDIKIVEFEYLNDASKHNFYYNGFNPLFWTLQKMPATDNLTTKETRYQDDGSIDIIIESSYEFDSAGYPTKWYCTYKDVSGNITKTSVSTISY